MLAPPSVGTTYMLSVGARRTKFVTIYWSRFVVDQPSRRTNDPFARAVTASLCVVMHRLSDLLVLCVVVQGVTKALFDYQMTGWRCVLLFANRRRAFQHAQSYQPTGP